MTDYKEIIGWVFGATIAVAWISFALLGPGNMIFLVVALSITIICGTLSGAFTALGRDKIEYKEAIGWVFGAVIPVAWIIYALLGSGNMVLLVVALTVTILCGTISGGLIALSKKLAFIQ